MAGIRREGYILSPIRQVERFAMPAEEFEYRRTGYSQPRFEELDRATVECSKDVIYIVDSELRITYSNPAWDQFALANGGAEVVAARILGTDLMRVIPEPLQRFYAEVLDRCRRDRVTYDFDFECSSAELYRLRHMHILPMKRSGELVIVTSARVEHIHDGPSLSPAAAYFNAHGLITMCCHCRRTQRADQAGVWDWVPAFLEGHNWQVTHGMCPVCVSYFYSDYLKKGASSDAA